MLKKILFLALPLYVVSCSILEPVPQPKREFRGFWVATVANIDWPKNGRDDLEKQKADFLNILAFYKDLNFNAAIVQIRTAGDAFYHSEHAPWSRFLTGKEGMAPGEDVDLLDWMISKTHESGMEFHAWLNPYRATFDLKTEVLSPTHDYFLHPEWMVKYGPKFYYDPGLPEVQKHLVAIMEELLQDYAIDAIHFDDYFYPYKIAGASFNDSLTYHNHHLKGQSLADWRRSNVDSLIKNVHYTIKTQKPWVQFGVSPFGVWKNKDSDPKGSDTKAGQTTYHDLYADPVLWMQQGWLDYLVPQVYWSMDLAVASHKKIVEWWANCSTNTNLYIGNGAYKIRNNGDKAWNKNKELPKQLKLARNTKAVLGNVLFSAKSLQNNNTDVVNYLKRKFYAHRALPPTSPHVPIANFVNNSNPVQMGHHDPETIRFEITGPEKASQILIYASGKRLRPNYSMQHLLVAMPADGLDMVVMDKERLGSHKYVAWTYLDKFGRESDPTLISLQKTNPYDTKK